ncbi:MAG: ribulose-phosphate 3-epimerase [bacterium]|nr:ribulose-phosphate 3-epimerase [bacterium]
MKKKVSVSFLSSKDIIDDLLEIDSTTADYVHVDVMDGRFVKKKFLPFKILNKLSYVLRKRFDVHLMVNEPIKFIEQYATLNTEFITIHVELGEIDNYIDLIKSYGIKVGLSIKPDTDVSVLNNYLDKIDLILIMSVEPGLGGQKFIEEATARIEKVKKMIGNRNILISVDGGINSDTISNVSKSDIVVSGSYIVCSDNFEEKINSLR